MIAKVTSTAFLLFKMVANIYNPFSVKTLGCTRDLLENFVVEIFDRKNATSFGVSSNIYSLGNLLGLLRTASLMRLVSTP